MLALAEAGLAAGEARWPGSDRFLVHAHLETNPATSTLDLTLHHGPVLPDHLRRLLTCDGRIRPVFEQEGTPVGERCDWSQLLIGPNAPPRPPPTADPPPSSERPLVAEPPLDPCGPIDAVGPP